MQHLLFIAIFISKTKASGQQQTVAGTEYFSLCKRPESILRKIFDLVISVEISFPKLINL